MRILQLIDSLEPGGAERMAVNLANILAEKIAFSGLIATRNEGALKETISPKVCYSFLNKKSAIDFTAIFKLRRFVQMNDIKYLHAHSSSFFIACLLKLIYPSVKIIWHDHYGNSEFLNKRPYFVLQVMSLFFFKIIVVNENLKKWCLQKLWCKQIIYLPNFPELTNSITSETILKGTSGKRIISLANLRPQKNHFLILDIAVILSKKYPQWSFHLIGKDFEDHYSETIKDRIIKNELQEFVYVYGSCNDIAAILAQVDIGIITSLSEGLPVALLEYGNFGIPVISSNVGDITKVIQNGINGIIIPNFEPKDFYQSIVHLIENEELKNNMGKKLQEEINRNYSAHSVCHNYLEFINA